MRDIHTVLFLFLMYLTFVSCGQVDPNKLIDEGSVDRNIYRSQEIGWTIEIPDGWQIISKNELEVNDKKGMDAIEEVQEGGFDYSGLKHLISFRKNMFNAFQSTSEPFELEYEGEWEDNNEALKGLVYKAFTNQGIKVDTSSSAATIDGLDFEVFHITVYGPNGDIILYQDMYSRHINGYDFGVNLNYNSDKDKEIMMKVWENSKFRKK